LRPSAASEAKKERTMTVLTPSREMELDAFDLDLRVVPAEPAQDQHYTDTASPFCPTGPTPYDQR
jgi:hypothetical protein